MLTTAGAGEERSSGTAPVVHRNAPRAFTAKIRSQSASVTCSNGTRPTSESAALFTTTSRRPYVSSTRANMACTCASSETSASIPIASGRVAASAAASPGSMPLTTTAAPSAAKRRHISAPRWRLPPVTSTVLLGDMRHVLLADPVFQRLPGDEPVELVEREVAHAQALGAEGTGD